MTHRCSFYHRPIGNQLAAQCLNLPRLRKREGKRERKERHPAAAVPITCDPSLFQIGNADSLGTTFLPLVLFELGSRSLVSHILDGILILPPCPFGITVSSLTKGSAWKMRHAYGETNPRLSESMVLIGAVINYFRRGYLAICSRHSSLFCRESVVGRSLHDEIRGGMFGNSLFFLFSESHFSLN